MEQLLKLLNASNEIEAAQNLTKLTAKVEDLEGQVKEFAGQLPKEGQVIVSKEEYDKGALALNEMKKTLIDQNEKRFGELWKAAVKQNAVKPSEKEDWLGHFFADSDHTKVNEFAEKMLKEKAGDMSKANDGQPQGASTKIDNDNVDGPKNFFDAVELIAKEKELDLTKREELDKARRLAQEKHQKLFDAWTVQGIGQVEVI